MSGLEMWVGIAITLTTLSLLLMVGGGLVLFLDWLVRKRHWVDSTKKGKRERMNQQTQ
jgi:hypothetical protein